MKSKLLILFTVLSSLIALDQWSKQMAVNHLKGNPALSFLNEFFYLVYAENPGVFLGLGGSMPESFRFWVFGVGVGLVILLVLGYVLKYSRSKFETISYSLVLAGGISNWMDRMISENGQVVDFLFIDLKAASFLKTGVFNLADIFISLGVLFILINEFKSKKPTQTEVV